MFKIKQTDLELIQSKITKEPLLFGNDGWIRARGCGCQGECRNTCGESCYKTK